jgi:hypothetical protein
MRPVRYEHLSRDAIVLHKTIACALETDLAVVLRQIWHWLSVNEKKKKPDHYRDGSWWTYNSYPAWQRDHFPFWSVDYIADLFRDLEALGLVKSANYNSLKADRTKWYTIRPIAFDSFMMLWERHGRPVKASNGKQNDAYKAFLAEWQTCMLGAIQLSDETAMSNKHAHDVHQTRPIPDTTTETNQGSSLESLSLSLSFPYSESLEIPAPGGAGQDQSKILHTRGPQGRADPDQEDARVLPFTNLEHRLCEVSGATYIGKNNQTRLNRACTYARKKNGLIENITVPCPPLFNFKSSPSQQGLSMNHRSPRRTPREPRTS